MVSTGVGVLLLGQSGDGRYDIGDALALRAGFADAQGVPKDPDDVTLTLDTPQGPQEVVPMAQLTHPGVGQFAYVGVAAEAGVHRYRWDGTGAVQAAAEGRFTVREQTV